MKIEFDKSFEKSLDRIRNKTMYPRIEKVILEFEEAKSISETQNIKKIAGFRNYHRIRLGEYRIGIETIDKNTIRFIIVAHRKEIYRLFPK
jgi:mRNA interferase RelE/StbE